MTGWRALPCRSQSAVTTAKKKFDLEQAMGDLERIVQQLESGELTLEKSLAEFEKGIKLSRECQNALATAEQKVQILLDGELKEAGKND